MQAIALLTPFSVLSPITSTWQYFSSVINRIISITSRHFGLLQNGALIAFGGKELLIDFIPKARQLAKTKGEKNSPFSKIETINTQFSLIHGIFYGASGILGGFEAMHYLDWLNLGKALPFFKYAASGLFLYVNLYSLEQHIKLYLQANILSSQKETRSLGIKLKVSSILGMINNIGYIISTFFHFFPPTEFIALILGLFSIFVGAVKIIFDFFAISKLSVDIPKKN